MIGFLKDLDLEDFGGSTAWMIMSGRIVCKGVSLNGCLSEVWPAAMFGGGDWERSIWVFSSSENFEVVLFLSFSS